MKRFILALSLVAAPLDAQSTCPVAGVRSQADTLIAESNRPQAPRKTVIRRLANRLYALCPTAVPVPPSDTTPTGPPPPADPVVLPTPTTSAPGSLSQPGPIASLTPVFSWSPVSGATGYVVAITNTATGQFVYPSSTGVGVPIAGASLQLPAGVLASGSAYRWDVTAVSATGKSLPSANRYFTTAPDTQPTPVPPATGIAAPELPRRVPSVPTGLDQLPCTVNVPAGGLQAALNGITAGSVLCLTGTHTGSFTVSACPASFAVIRSAGAIPSGRMTPTKAAPLAKIVANGTGALSALRFASRSCKVLVLGVEIAALETMTQGPTALVEVGGGETVIGDLPTDIAFERVYAHGWPTQHIRRAFTLNGGAQTVRDSWCSEIHASGYDSQCVITWAGSGPFLIENNTLEAASENIMFGGGDPRIQGLIPSDITIRRNHIRKPIAWKGQGWNTKVLIESKNSARVLIENNVLDGAWADGQVGYAFNLKSTSQDGSAPWSSTSDWTIRRNLIRNTGGGFALAGRADGTQTDSSNRRILLDENWVEPINVGPYTGDARPIMFTADNADVNIRRNVFEPGGEVVAVQFDASGNTVRNLAMTGNVLPRGMYGLFTGGASEGLPSWNAPAGPLGVKTWTNAIIGSTGAIYPAGTTWHSALASALAAAGSVTRATIDAGLVGVVVPP